MMRIPGLKTAKLSMRWLRSCFIDRVLILGYHRVAEVCRDPYSICVNPRHFAEQLEVLYHHAQPISLREAVQGLQRGNLPNQAVVLTLDDGYADSLYGAKPLLERYQIPATAFIATGYIGREFWWDELERILRPTIRLPERLCLCINDSVYEWSLDDSAHIALENETHLPRQNLLQSLHKQLLPLSAEERGSVMAQLRSWTGADPNEPPLARALTSGELTELASGGLVDIGSHSVTHPVLSKLPLEQQRIEIQQSRTELMDLLGQPVTSFSYPNGVSTEETRALVQHAGFLCACTSFNDVAWRGSDRFYLPRFWIPNCDGATFLRWLKKWLNC